MMNRQQETWQDKERARRYAKQTRLVSSLTVAPFARRVVACLEPGIEDPAVVDLGGGPGLLGIELGRLRPRARIIVVDPSTQMLQIARENGSKAGQKNFEARQGTAEEIPLVSCSVDLVISQSSFHEWEDPRSGLVEIHRILRPGGRMVLRDYDRAWLSAWKRKLLGLLHPLHMFRFSFNDVASMARETGFQQIERKGKGWQYLLLATKQAV
jgi:ubiquinone/menaquinone biosynthesis C-methylase UbiE